MNTSITTEDLLWSISNKDDRDAYRSLFEIYYPQLCLYAKRFIDDKSVREDIVQDIFFSIWDKRKSITLTTSANGYLTSSVKNYCLNYLRKESYSEQYKNSIHEIPFPYVEGPDKLYNLQELQELLDHALTKLPEEYRLAFIMNRFEDKSSKEIAEIMNVSVRTVERYRIRAIELLKNELKDYLPLILLLL